jgi:hypothetical protein
MKGIQLSCAIVLFVVFIFSAVAVYVGCKSAGYHKALRYCR